MMGEVAALDKEDFAKYVMALPESLETDLVAGDTVSTAFYLARRAGWSVEQLAEDARKTLVREPGSVGLVVARLRTLATMSPHTDRPATKKVSGPPAYLREPRSYLPAEQAAERNALIRRIREERIPPETAYSLMDRLIEEQRSR